MSNDMKKIKYKDKHPCGSTIKGWHNRLQLNYWITKYWVKLTPKEMSTEHLINTKRLILKQAKNVKFYLELEMLSLPEPSGDASKLAWEQEMHGFFLLPLEKWLEMNSPIYNAIKEELKNRGE